MTQMQGDICVTRYSDSSAFLELRPFWNSLLESTSINNPFLSWEWQSTWWRNYGHQYALWLLVARENDIPVGIFPLMRFNYQKKGIAARGLCIIGKSDIDFCGIIVPENRGDVLEALGRYLQSCRKEWDILRLVNCCGCAQHLEPFLKIFNSKSHLITGYQEVPHLYLPIDHDWQISKTNLSGKLRRKIRTKQSKLENDHAFRFLHLRGDEISEECLQDFFEIGLQGHYPTLYQNEIHRMFHRDLIRTMQDRKWANMNLFYVDGRPCAYHYGFIYQNKYFAWRTAFNPQFEEYAPGLMILNHTLEFFSREGITEMDFLRGDSQYKREWTNTYRVYCEWQIFRRWSLAALVFVHLANLKTTLKSFFLERPPLKQSSADL